MKTNNMINRAKNTTVGKVLCRLVGEEAGQTMMEYVIIAVLIAAACTAAIAYFGRGVATESGVAQMAMAGNANGAAAAQAEAVSTADANAQSGVEEAKKFSKTENE